LAKQVREIRRDFPFSRLFLVGHSHGGNVALYSLLKCGGSPDTTVQHEVSGVVCMATPFFAVHGARDILFQIVFVSLFWILGFVLIEEINLAFFRGIGGVMIGLLNIMWLGLTVMFFPVFFTGFGARWAQHRLRMPVVRVLPLLVIRSAGDEATSFLGLLQPLNRIADWIWRAVTQAVPRLLWNSYGAVALITLICASTYLAWTRDVAPVFVEGVLGRVLISFPVFVLAVYALRFASVLGHGYDLAAAASGLDVTVETAPVGTCQFIQLTAPSSSWIRHSAVYADRRAITGIKDWLNATAIPGVGAVSPRVTPTAFGVPDHVRVVTAFVDLFEFGGRFERDMKRVKSLVEKGEAEEALTIVKREIKRRHLNDDAGPLFLELARLYSIVEDEPKADAALREAFARQPPLRDKAAQDAVLRSLPVMFCPGPGPHESPG
jgi:hypothetical protein